jgi:hypothetical protein
VATSFDLQSHHQAILSHISTGTLSGSAHFWDPKMFTTTKDCGCKCGSIYDKCNKISNAVKSHLSVAPIKILAPHYELFFKLSLMSLT